MSLLRSYLDANSILSAADLEAAARHQQAQGGSLDTALLELGLLSPADLDGHLGKACGLPTAPARLIESGPTRPWGHVPKALLEIGWVLPLALEDSQVFVAVHPDLPDARLGQLYRQIRGFTPMVTPECCLVKLNAERTGGIVPPRYAMLCLDVLDALRAREPAGTTLVGVPVVGQAPGAPAAPAPITHTIPYAAARIDVDGPAGPPPPSRPPARAPQPAADSQTATVIEPVLEDSHHGGPGDSFTAASTVSRPVHDPSTAGTFPVTRPDSGVFTAAGTSGTYTRPQDPRARAAVPQDSRPAPVPQDSRSPASSQSRAPVPQDSRSPASSQSRAPVPQDSRSPASSQSRAPVPQDSRSPASSQSRAPVPQDSRTPIDGRAPAQPGAPQPAAPGDRRAAAPVPQDSRSPIDGRAPAQPGAPQAPTPGDRRASDRRAAEPAGPSPVPSDSRAPAEPAPSNRTHPRSGGVTPARGAPLPQLPLAQRLAPARAALSQARERDRITESLVRAAIQVAPRVALFGVKREGLRALAAPGSSLHLPRSLVIPIPDGSLLDRAVSGEIRLRLLTEPQLAFAVGRPLGIPCILEPVYAQARCVLMLYIDRSGSPFEAVEQAAVRDLCDVARSSLEALLRIMGLGNRGDLGDRPGVDPDSALVDVGGYVARTDAPSPDAWTTPPADTDRAPAGAARADADHKPADADAWVARPAVETQPADDRTPDPDTWVSRPAAAKPADDRTPDPDTWVSRPAAAQPADPDEAKPADRDRDTDEAKPADRERDTDEAKPADRDTDASEPAAKPDIDRGAYTSGPGSRPPEPAAPPDTDRAADAPEPSSRPPEPAAKPDTTPPTRADSDGVPELTRRPRRPVIALVNPIRREPERRAWTAAADAYAPSDAPPAEAETDAPTSTDHAAPTRRLPAADAAHRAAADNLQAPVPEDMSAGDGARAPVPADIHERAGADGTPVSEDSSAGPASARHAPVSEDSSTAPSGPASAHPAPVSKDSSASAHRTPVSEDSSAPAHGLPVSEDRSPAARAPSGPAAARHAPVSEDRSPDAPGRPVSDDGATDARPQSGPVSASRDSSDAARAPSPSDSVRAQALSPAEILRAAFSEPAPSEGPRAPAPPESTRAPHPANLDFISRVEALRAAVTDGAPAPVDGDANEASASSSSLNMPNLVAPGRRALGKRGDRTRPADAVVIIPTDLRRPDAPAAAPAQPTLQIPASLIAPAPLPGSTRRGKAGPAHPTPPRAEDITLNMPRLVRNPTILPEPGAAPLQAAAEAHAADPADLAQEPAPTTAAEPPASDLSQAPARDDLSQAPAQDDLSQAPAPAEPAPTAAEPTPATPVTPADPDAALAAYLQDPEDPAALASLRSLGEALYPRIAARFPGPIDPRSAADVRSFPPPSSHGPLLRLCVEIGPPITRHILDLLEHQRPQIRFYAAFLFQELRDPRSLRPLAGHAFDPDPDVRLIATRVLESYSRVEGFVPATEVVRSALSGRDRDRALLATEAAGTLRDTRAVPILIDLLSVRDKQIREASLEALCSITAKHHGYRPAKWKAWYADHQDQPRVLWVMEALKHRDPAVRRWAAEELLRVTGHRIPAPPEGEKITPRYVLRAWEAWFEQHGADFG